jgi:hypothetical protein
MRAKSAQFVPPYWGESHRRNYGALIVWQRLASLAPSGATAFGGCLINQK